MKALSSGVPLQVHDSLDSTSLEALRYLDGGGCGPLWILARLQTAGYGRRGRAWQQETGNLAATLVLKPAGTLAEQPAAAGFALSLALGAALEQARVKPRDIQLKWPNDVLLAGGKVSGILLERHMVQGDAFLAIGVGVNLVHKPDLPDYPTAAVKDATSEAPDPEAFLDTLDKAFQHWLGLLERQGFAPLRDAWLERAGGLGRQITVRLPNETLHGVFEGLDETGALILRQGEVISRINTGDVFF
ncbi:biotin--[acetyl-CoA-carboxylase] ligase [Aquisalinus flavus]|uniref:biotin--[biotin carboxyl-carrier protein] ligase n=1 Tax=Aquisalinus flavus TaxID=1526572 RepID=A0A8J2V1X5_9PROT|nr:biotin--[acetyl-CoA-carboxylase] ligase [Aquisalinus flavus]MBD0426667.1 biotin--[acetyl-CoA-carboxylase] ligase [Aquisalinus flavus]UNE47791.1 biotin--[acetyl-CoA-carboxylase] ligase [Aquisalinus flavus]GGD06019.1 biotin--[acetyl-CoA-carboxylase] ligase [Aquisalinus flavus]